MTLIQYLCPWHQCTSRDKIGLGHRFNCQEFANHSCVSDALRACWSQLVLPSQQPPFQTKVNPIMKPWEPGLSIKKLFRTMEHREKDRWLTFRALIPGQTVLPTQANSSQVHSVDGVGYRLATHLAGVGSSWLESSSNSSHVFHVWRPQPTQANSRQVVLLLLCDYTVVFRQLNSFLQAGPTGRIVWPHAGASFDFVTWLELAWVRSTVWPAR